MCSTCQLRGCALLNSKMLAHRQIYFVLFRCCILLKEKRRVNNRKAMARVSSRLVTCKSCDYVSHGGKRPFEELPTSSEKQACVYVCVPIHCVEGCAIRQRQLLLVGRITGDIRPTYTQKLFKNLKSIFFIKIHSHKTFLTIFLSLKQL